MGDGVPDMPEQLFNDKLNIPGSGLYAFIKINQQIDNLLNNTTDNFGININKLLNISTRFYPNDHLFVRMNIIKNFKNIIICYIVLI